MANEVNKEMENEEMTERTNIDDFLAVRGFGAYGGGYGFGGGQGMYPGNSMLAAGAHADGTATKTAVDCHFAASAAALDRISAQNEENRRISQNDRLNKAFIDSEFRNSDRLRDIEREMAANARVADKNACDAILCCKETQCLIKEESAKTRFEAAQTESRLAQRMESIETGRVRDENAKLQGRVNQLEIFRECGCGCAGGVRPCPPPAG